MKIAILSANLGNFDKPIPCAKQILPEDWEVSYHTFTDEDFPPIIGLTPRMQYRIPKMFGWQMFPDYDYYIWLDGSMSLQHPDSVKWFIDKCGGHDMALFRHPWRKTMKEETDHIEEKLKENNRYITPRYKNGLHKEQLAECLADSHFEDKALYTSTAFVYKNNYRVQEALKFWWYHSSRYFTCDQIVLPYVVFKGGLDINVIQENQFKIPYITLTSKHK